MSVAARIAERRPVTLSIVGRGPDLERLRGLAARHSAPGLDVQVHHGVTDREKVGLLDAADALLFLPRYEVGEFDGLGLVCLEAAARLRPSVVLPCGGSPFAVHDGVSGLVVHSWSGDLCGSLAEAVDEAIQVFDAEQTRAWTDAFRFEPWQERTRAALEAGSRDDIDWERVWPSPI